MMAISYAAENRARQKVFFKQYKSPAPTVVWYEDFVRYQKELSRRVLNGKAAHYAVHQLDAFEALWGGPCYFQAFEFVENGADLQQILDQEREQHRKSKIAPAKDPGVWARHTTWAKVLVGAVAALHESRIVHADLKPANAYLIQDRSITSGYQLKLIDMDFSLLSDHRAPWHGFQGYVGTENYRSPEHLTRGAVPTTASDVFTCGLILGELLTGNHPYWSEDPGEYARKVQSHAAEPLPLLGMMPGPADNREVSAALHRALSPDPARRPTATELQGVLTGRVGRSAVGRVPDTTPRAPQPRRGSTGAEPATSGPIISAERIELAGPEGRSLTIGVRTELGKTLLQPFGADSAYWDARQCVLERDTRRQWVVTPIPGTTNETLINGETVVGPRPLRQGDRLAVGRQERGVAKLTLVVSGKSA
jgi:serine/threonine protein kinase